MTKLSPHTDITILLDRSGSMASIKSAMESGFDEFLSKHRETPSTRLSLVQFDGTQPYDVVYTEQPIADVPRLTLEPRGMTPLRDALCRTIDEVGRRLRDKRESARPSKVLFLVITDGLENASREHTVKDVKRRIKTQTNEYRWEFVYLGANQDALVEAEKLGIDLGKAITFTAGLRGTANAWSSLTTNTSNYVSDSSPMASVTNYSSHQRKQAIETDSSDDRVKQTTTTTNGTS